jgi:hypothetical protein
VSKARDQFIKLKRYNKIKIYFVKYQLVHTLDTLAIASASLLVLLLLSLLPVEPLAGLAELGGVKTLLLVPCDLLLGEEGLVAVVAPHRGLDAVVAHHLVLLRLDVVEARLLHVEGSCAVLDGALHRDRLAVVADHLVTLLLDGVEAVLLHVVALGAAPT